MKPMKWKQVAPGVEICRFEHPYPQKTITELAVRIDGRAQVGLGLYRDGKSDTQRAIECAKMYRRNWARR